MAHRIAQCFCLLAAAFSVSAAPLKLLDAQPPRSSPQPAPPEPLFIVDSLSAYALSREPWPALSNHLVWELDPREAFGVPMGAAFHMPEVPAAPARVYPIWQTECDGRGPIRSSLIAPAGSTLLIGPR